MVGALKSYLAKTIRRQFLASPAQEASRGGPLVVAGLFRTASGMGQSARLCADAMEELGQAVIRCDLSAAFHQTDLPPDSRLAPFPPDRRGAVIVHLNASETVKGLFKLGLIGDKHWRIIGYWVWELERAPQSWRKEAKLLSEIWTPSRFSAEAISAVTDTPVKVAPHWVRPPKTTPTALFRQDIPAGDVVTLTMADGRSSFSRKNIEGAVRAFIAGVGAQEHCWLIVKTRNLKRDPALMDRLNTIAAGHPRIKILDQSICEAEKWALLQSCDIFLSLHRAEGFGLVLAEAMALGKAVIATGWSGNMDFMDDDTAYLTPARLAPIEDASAIYHSGEQSRWAEPNIEDAATALRRLVASKNERDAMGARAKVKVASLLTGNQYLTAFTGV